MTRRAIAAALTPLRDDGARPDLDAIPPYAAFLAAGGIDGILALGSTGEGILLSVAERKDVLSAFAACELPVIAHCGAQTTADTVALAEHAATAGAAGVAVIGPPYFPLDDESLLRHFAAAARACDPLPFYVYEFERISGYAVPLAVVDRLRELAPNLAGLKVSDSPFDKVRPYLVDGLDLFVGAEALIGEALAAGRSGRGQRAGVGVPRRRGRGGPDGRLDAGRRAPRAARPLPAAGRAEGRRRLEGRADRGRTCARRCGGCRTTSGASLFAALEAFVSRT